MNIMLVTPWRPSLTGGISTVVARLTGEFQKKGHNITIFVADRENRLRQIEALDDNPSLRHVSPVACLVASILFVPWSCVVFGFRLRWYNSSGWLRRKQLDAVLIQYPLPAMFYFGILKRVFGGTLFITYQGNDAHDLCLMGSARTTIGPVLIGEVLTWCWASHERSWPKLNQFCRASILGAVDSFPMAHR
jgi:glycosyltransferase involved in cell wall biosynthesis